VAAGRGLPPGTATLFRRFEETTMSAQEVREHLVRLRAQRADALVEGVGGVPGDVEDLDHEIAATREAYVAVAVTEIATLRGELFGREFG
jgi:hypothetical protein